MIRYFTDYSKGGASFVLTVTFIFASLWANSDVVEKPKTDRNSDMEGAMALLDKLGRDDVDGHITIPSHEWSAALSLYALGIATRSKIIAEFNLEVSDEPQLDALLATIDALNADGKAKYHGKIESLNIFLERRSITKAQYKTLLGF